MFVFCFHFFFLASCFHDRDIVYYFYSFPFQSNRGGDIVHRITCFSGMLINIVCFLGDVYFAVAVNVTFSF